LIIRRPVVLFFSDVPILKPPGVAAAPKEVGCVAGVDPNPPPPNEVVAGVVVGGIPKLPVAGVVGAPKENAAVDVAGANPAVAGMFVGGANPAVAGVLVEVPNEN
jgi:hypothetical protein